MEYEMTPAEKRGWVRELRLTELTFLEMELNNRENEYTPEYRRDMEKRVAQLREMYKDYLADPE